MKTRILKTMLFGLLLTGLSCNTERAVVTTAESLKSQQMIDFDNALRSLMKAENRSNSEEKARLGTQLNDRSLNILYAASKQLLESHGVNSQTLEFNNREDKEKVISKASEIYFQNYSKIQTQVKNEN
ncbi:hypothetical protein P0M11_11300 [Kaistella sp. PBT33-4]|uniref:hypothetical protein n=1 Tax=Kaistella sp. PBT33-4 TaxID=3032000 RepID=UPI0023D849F5|nr:hypothetical protein [Kaistella sp. PBT33-4]MDF0720583.1 hypothetical protein [Kaistella sp. PBT33-4]